MPKIKACWRCGVDFDESEFIEGAPCRDCQYEEPPGEWIRLDEALAAYYERRDRLILSFYNRMYSDKEIGDAIGMSDGGVAKWRKRHGYPKHGFVGYEKWKDPEAVAEASRQRMLTDNPKGGWTKGRKHSGDSRVKGVLSNDPSGPYKHW